MKKSLEDLIGAIFGTLFVLVFALVMGFVAAVTFYLDGICFKSLFMLIAWLASTGILWSTPLVLQKIHKNKEVHMDERGLMIFKNSALAALTVSFLYFLSACFVAWWIVGPDGSVSVNVIPLIFVGWIVIFQFALVFSNLILDRLG